MKTGKRKKEEEANQERESEDKEEEEGKEEGRLACGAGAWIPQEERERRSDTCVMDR